MVRRGIMGRSRMGSMGLGSMRGMGSMRRMKWGGNGI